MGEKYVWKGISKYSLDGARLESLLAGPILQNSTACGKMQAYLFEGGKKKIRMGREENPPNPPSPGTCSFRLLSSVLLHASYPSPLTGWNDPKPDIGRFLAF